MTSAAAIYWPEPGQRLLAEQSLSAPLGPRGGEEDLIRSSKPYFELSELD